MIFLVILVPVAFMAGLGFAVVRSGARRPTPSPSGDQ